MEKLKARVDVRPQQLACKPTNNVYMIGTTKNTKKLHMKVSSTHCSSTTAQHINFLILKFWAYKAHACNCAMN